jgi:hypothetical protein
MAGIPVDYIDTQDITITNTTDAISYDQATNIRFYIQAALTRRQRTDSIFENLWDLVTPAVEADIMVTQPEIAALVALTAQTNNEPPVRSWAVAMSDEGGTTTTLSGSAQLARLQFIDEGIGGVKYNIRLEYSESAVTVT